MEVSWERIAEIVAQHGDLTTPGYLSFEGKMIQERYKSRFLMEERSLWIKEKEFSFVDKLRLFESKKENVDRYYILQQKGDSILLCLAFRGWFSFWTTNEDFAKQWLSERQNFTVLTPETKLQLSAFPLNWVNSVPFELEYNTPCCALYCTPEHFNSSLRDIELSETSINHSGKMVEYLQIQDAVVIANNWAYGTKYYYPENRIFSAPSSCIRDENGDIISWALTHYDLSIGFVFTLPQHRGKGLATRCVEVLVARLFAFLKVNNEYQYAHCLIEENNEQSKNLFTSLGFRTREQKVVWSQTKD